MDGVRYMMRLEAQACATFEAQETSKDDPSLLLSSPPLSSFPPSSSLLFSSPSGLVKLLSMRSLGFWWVSKPGLLGFWLCEMPGLLVMIQAWASGWMRRVGPVRWCEMPRLLTMIAGLNRNVDVSLEASGLLMIVEAWALTLPGFWLCDKPGLLIMSEAWASGLLRMSEWSKKCLGF